MSEFSRESTSASITSVGPDKWLIDVDGHAIEGNATDIDIKILLSIGRIVQERPSGENYPQTVFAQIVPAREEVSRNTKEAISTSFGCAPMDVDERMVSEYGYGVSLDHEWLVENIIQEQLNLDYILDGKVISFKEYDEAVEYIETVFVESIEAIIQNTEFILESSRNRIGTSGKDVIQTACTDNISNTHLA